MGAWTQGDALPSILSLSFSRDLPNQSQQGSLALLPFSFALVFSATGSSVGVVGYKAESSRCIWGG